MEFDLVFEGGGAKGMVFVGAMQEFEARGHTYKRLLGTSAGAITAALLAAGYTSQEMLAALAETENGRSVFNSFLAQPGPFQRAEVLKSATLTFVNEVNISWLPDVVEKRLDKAMVEWISATPQLACPYSLLEYGGWYSADHFVAWLQKRLDTGLDHGKVRHYSGMTLAQFYEATYSDLSVVASDTTEGAMLVLNHRTAPDLPLVWAVRMSMSIPLLWQEVLWRPDWGQYRGRDMTNHAIVDGGLLSNFPIELFISRDDVVTSLMGPEPADNVLGLLIDEDEPVPGAAQAAPSRTMILVEQAPVIRRINNLINTTLSARDKMVIDAYEKLVARMPAKGYGTTEFDMSDERRGLLVDAGCEAMKTYFDQLEQTQEQVPSFGLGDETAPASSEAADGQRHADKVARKILDR